VVNGAVVNGALKATFAYHHGHLAFARASADLWSGLFFVKENDVASTGSGAAAIESAVAAMASGGVAMEIGAVLTESASSISWISTVSAFLRKTSFLRESAFLRENAFQSDFVIYCDRPCQPCCLNCSCRPCRHPCCPKCPQEAPHSHLWGPQALPAARAPAVAAAAPAEAVQAPQAEPDCLGGPALFGQQRPCSVPSSLPVPTLALETGLEAPSSARKAPPTQEVASIAPHW